jgi:hypothetical protein
VKTSMDEVLQKHLMAAKAIEARETAEVVAEALESGNGH